MDKGKYFHIKIPENKIQLTIAMVCALLVAYLQFPAYFDYYMPPLPKEMQDAWKSLDPSWIIALNYAKIKSLVFGQDFIFTYGPLSFLSTRYMWGIHEWTLVFYDLFIACNFFAITYIHLARKDTNTRSTLFLAAMVSLILPQYFGSGNSLALLAFLLFWVRENLEKPDGLNYAMQLALLFLVFFIKLNTGMSGLIIFLAGGSYNLIYKDKKILSAVALLAILPLVYFGSQYLNINISAYFSGALQIVTGYNGIMYLEEGYTNELVFAILIIILSLVVLVHQFISSKTHPPRAFLVTSIYLLVCFNYYKQGFVRADIQHISEFYAFFLLPVFGIREFHHVVKKYFMPEILLAVVFITLFFAKKRQEDLINFKGKCLKTGYFQRLSHVLHEGCIVTITPFEKTIPEEIIQKTGTRSIDIYPWNIQLLIENGLNYTPRPISQSYTAYTPYLEKQNFSFYQSDNAPEFVLYQYDAIDNRYALFDEPLVNLCLLKNYTFSDSFRDGNRLMLLLQNNHKSKLKIEKNRVYDANTNIKLKPDTDLFYTIDVEKNIKGMIRSFFYHEPEINLQMNLDDGSTRTFRTSAALLASGLFGNNLINNTSDFMSLIDPKSQISLQRIKSYSILLNPDYFKKTCRVTEWHL